MVEVDLLLKLVQGHLRQRELPRHVRLQDARFLEHVALWKHLEEEFGDMVVVGRVGDLVVQGRLAPGGVARGAGAVGDHLDILGHLVRLAVFLAVKLDLLNTAEG